VYKRLSNKIYNRGGTNCEILSLERNVIILTSRNIHELRADLRSTYEIDGRFAVPERQAGLKNVPAARQLLPEENSAEVCYVVPSGGITINEFGREPSEESYKKHAA